jgi:hypothetical protein
MNPQISKALPPRIGGLPPPVVRRAQRAYAALYRCALPHAGPISLRRIEIAAFDRAASWREFQRIGLGLETVVIHREAGGGGHTGKILMNLPGQFLLEHRHVDTYVLPAGASIPSGFRRLRDLVRGFQGLRAYAENGAPLVRRGRPVYAWSDRAFTIVQPEKEAEWPETARDEVVAFFPAKSETFKAIYGGGVLLHRGARVLYAPPGTHPDRVPRVLQQAVRRLRDEEVITTEECLHMAPGVEVLLPGHAPHAFCAGARGAVYLEFSAPSMDEADRFTDPRVIR